MGLPAAKVSDRIACRTATGLSAMAICVGHADAVAPGGFAVTIGGASGGIVSGGPTMLIG